MAVNVKYYHEYKPEQAGQYRINLCDSDFTGSATSIEMASTPFTLNWDNEDPHARVISSSCTLNFICETQAQVDWFEEVAASPTGTYTVEILEGTAGNFFWAGVIQAESVTIPYLTVPVVISVEANDDLARLADSYHNQTGLEGGTPYSETNELTHVHLRRCLSRLRIFHHWDNTDNFLQLLSYYETSPGGTGLTGLYVASSAWDLTQDGEANEAFTDLEVLEEFCKVFNSRLIFYGGIFYFHSLPHLETAVDYEVDVINYSKAGTLYSPVTVDVEEPFTNITKLAGWSTTFVPALKSVSLGSNGGYIGAIGAINALPNFNQQVYPQNSLDGTFYNTTGDAYPYTLMGQGNGYFAQRQNELTLVEVLIQAGFDAFTLSETDDVDECIRVKVSVLHYVDLFGTNQGTKRYAKRTATFDTVATSPIIGESGQTIECATVEYSEITWTTNSADRLIFYSPPIHCGGNVARAADELMSFALPAINTAADALTDAAAPRIGGLLEVVKHDGTALSAANQTTVDAAWAIGYFLAPRVYNTQTPVNTGDDATSTEFTATQQTGDYRENLDLGNTHFGLGVNSPAYLMSNASGAVATDFDSSGNVDGTDYILQLIVKDVLRLRSKPRRLFKGYGMLSNTISFPFHKIYTDDGRRYALLGGSLDGGTNISSLTFFELDYDGTTTISDTDIPDKWRLGAQVSLPGGGMVLAGSTFNLSAFLAAAAANSTASKAELAVSRIFTKDERRMHRQTLLVNGQFVVRPLDDSDTTQPGIKIFAPNTAGGAATDSLFIQPNNPKGNEVMKLPEMPTSTGSHFITMRTVGTTGTMASTVAYGTTAGHVLTMVDVSGTLTPQFAAASGGSGGGFYTVTGYAGFKGTGAAWINLLGIANVTDTTSSLINFCVPEDCTASEFSIFSDNAGGSSSFRLYVNGTSTETETVNLLANSGATGTFSTSLSAGDVIRFQLNPLTNPGNVNIAVKLSV